MIQGGLLLPYVSSWYNATVVAVWPLMKTRQLTGYSLVFVRITLKYSHVVRRDNVRLSPSQATATVAAAEWQWNGQFQQEKSEEKVHMTLLVAPTHAKHIHLLISTSCSSTTRNSNSLSHEHRFFCFCCCCSNAIRVYLSIYFFTACWVLSPSWTQEESFGETAICRLGLPWPGLT